VSGEVNEDLLSSFQVVVMINATLDEQLRVNDLCHKKGVCYISCDARGVFAYAFCDFGDAFVVSDVDGNQAASCVVSSVTKDAIGLVTVMDDQRHNLVTGDVVTFNSVQGMTEVSMISNFRKIKHILAAPGVSDHPYTKYGVAVCRKFSRIW